MSARPDRSAEVRTVRVAALTRVEGEGGLYVKLAGDEVREVRLEIYEPPRFFEALLRGRPLEETPDITARICGICPVAYQMSAVHALEQALGIEVTAELRRLRRLLYCGEWIESHALHMHLLHAPDFLGLESGLELAARDPAALERGLMLKKHGNRLVEVVGGRAVHPINVAVGGFYRLPRADELAALVDDFRWGLEAAVEAARWVARLDFPDFPRREPLECVALVADDEYPMNHGRIGSSLVPAVGVDQFPRQFREHQVPHSTALHARHEVTGGTYLVGPLARVNLNRPRLGPTARRVADEIGFETPCTNPFRSIVARGLEVIHAYEEALEILTTYRPRGAARVPYEHRAGAGAAATEAPRGLLYHRYEVDARGRIVAAVIVPPTSQNQAQIEADLRIHLAANLERPEPALAAACERLVRSYDPCISCSTHFLKLTVERQ